MTTTDSVNIVSEVIIVWFILLPMLISKDLDIFTILWLEKNTRKGKKKLKAVQNFSLFWQVQPIHEIGRCKQKRLTTKQSPYSQSRLLNDSNTGMVTALRKELLSTENCELPLSCNI